MKTDVHSQADQTALMRRYLLGALAEAEQSALEQQFFADSEVLDRVWAVENDLVDEYVRGQLLPVEREQFEQHYLASPGHRERLAFAQTMLPMTDQMALKEGAATVSTRSPEAADSFWAKMLAIFHTPQFALSAGLTVFLMLISGLWLMNERTRWQQQLAQAQAERSVKEQRAQELENRIAEQREQNSQLSAELERLRAELRRAAEAPSASSSNSTVFSFLLLPSVRAGSEQQTLKIPSNTSQVRFQTKIERRDSHRYQASVRAVDSGESWPATSAKAIVNKGNILVSVFVPAAKLKRGDYILTLTGIDAAGTAEEIDRYFFRVDSK